MRLTHDDFGKIMQRGTGFPLTGIQIWLNRLSLHKYINAEDAF